MREDHFLDNEDNWKGRKIKEAVYINTLNLSVTMNPSRVMNLERGFELDAIWSEFNSVFIGYIKRKWKINFASWVRVNDET